MLQVSLFDHIADTRSQPWGGDWAAFADRLMRHDEGEKNGPYFTAATFTGSRKRDNLEARGVAVLDIERRLKSKGEPPPALAEIVEAIGKRGWSAVIYTTHSHKADDPRYRLVFPIASAIDLTDQVNRQRDEDAILGLADALGLVDWLDRKSLFAEQPMFFGRHAPGAPFKVEKIEGRAIDPSTYQSLSNRGRDLREAEEAEDDRRRAKARAEAASRAPRDGDVIAAFNKAYPLEEALSRYGYAKKPGSSRDWRSRYQRSGSYATQVYSDNGRERWVSLSESDIEAGVGPRSASGRECYGDSFQLFAHYEHNGDTGAAVRAAAAELGIKRAKPDPEPWGPARCEGFDDEPPPEGEPKAEEPRGADFAPGSDRRHEAEDQRQRFKAQVAEDIGKRVVTYDDLATKPRTQNWLIRNVVKKGSLTTIYGRQKSFKSFVALDMGVCIALGRPWGGFKVEQAPVVYIVSEGGNAIADRVAAHKRRNNIADGAPIAVFKVALNLGIEKGDLPRLIAVVELVARKHFDGVLPGAVFVDTLARNLGSADESKEGMRAFIANCGGLQERFGCAVLPVHHEGLDKGRMRGGTVLPAAVDGSMRITRQGELGALVTLEDMRDAAAGVKVEVTLEAVDLGEDRYPDGSIEKVASLAVVETKARADTKEERRAEAAIEDRIILALAKKPVRGGAPGLAREIGEVMVNDTTRKAAAQRARRAADRLIESGYVRHDKGTYSLTPRKGREYAKTLREAGVVEPSAVPPDVFPEEEDDEE